MLRNRSLAYLGSRIVVFAVVVSGVPQIGMAQASPALQQNSEPTPLYNDDPMSLPPRTAPPPAVEESARPDSIQPISKDGNSQDDQGRFVFKKQVQEVVLHATVVDESGQLVTSLDRNAFTVYQNGQPQTITSFRREDVPVAIGIVVDNSGSMRDKRAKVSQAVVNLLQASNPHDEIFVVNFSQTPYLDQDFTSNANLLQAALHQVSTRGSTALYDAVVASEVHLRNNPRLNKKVLLVITDGQDNMSRETLDSALRKLESNKGPTVYAIGLTDSGLTHTGRDALQRLASETGGVAFFPNTLEDVDSITKAVARDVRSQYTLTYSPGSTAGQGYQRIKVEAKNGSRKRLDVRTRDGYYPGETLR
jgi:Ca-activated chloride channel family protein